MENILNMTSVSQESTGEQTANETVNETNMVFFATTCKFQDGTIGLLKHGIGYSAFRGAVEEEISNPTPAEEISTLLDLQVAYWKGQLDKERALFYTFSFLTASQLVSRSTLETYNEQKTFGILMELEEGFNRHKTAVMPIEAWNNYIEQLERIIADKNYYDRLIRQTCDTLFELNYDLHHATILDNDEEAAAEATKRINNCIDMFASIFVKIGHGEDNTYQNAVDRMRSLNQFAFDQTREIVLEHGRNHFTGG